MFCKNCGCELKDEEKFCTNCGAKVANSNNKNSNTNKIIVAIIAVFILVTAVILLFIFLNNQNMKGEQAISKTMEQISQNLDVQPKNIQKTPSDILDEINSYQTKYWEIVKRNDVLLQISDDNKNAIDDRGELVDLFAEIENKIDKNNEFLKRYYEIEKEFENNTGETTPEMNAFAAGNYDEVDKLLNDTYKAVKAKLNEDDFQQLKLTQRKWLKDVEAYYPVFEEQGFGTIGTLVKLNYEINMRNFRTLLLMLYL